MDKEDENIVKGIRERDMYALNKLIDSYGTIIYNVVTSILNEGHENESVEECTDDILMSIWRNIDYFSEEIGNLKCWIAAISKNKALTYKKKLKKFKNNIDIDKIKISSSINLEEDYLKDNNRESIIELLNNLSIKDNEIFIKRYFKDYSIEEIAKDMNLTSISVYNRLSRGRKKLKKILSLNKEV